MISTATLELLPPMLAGLSLVAWAALLRRLARWSRKVPGLDESSPRLRTLPDGARLSLIVAAKDEAACIEASVRSFLAQDVANLEIVAVNDRSTDDTGAILARLAAANPGYLEAIDVTHLPAGWGGQNHALDRGVSASSGDWLCFTDADCRFERADTLAIALAFAKSRNADLVSILPEMSAPSRWEQAYLPACCLIFLASLGTLDVEAPGPANAYANGAFLLVRRSTYEAIGGHRQVRGLVNDDIALAQRAKQAGFRLALAGNSGLLRTRMYETLPEAWNGWTRNFAGAMPGAGALVASLAMTTSLFFLPFATAAFGIASLLAAETAAFADLAGVVFAAFGIALAQLTMGITYPKFGAPARMSLFWPFGVSYVAAIQIRALARVVRRRPTVWQGARYPAR